LTIQCKYKNVVTGPGTPDVDEMAVKFWRLLLTFTSLAWNTFQKGANRMSAGSLDVHRQLPCKPLDSNIIILPLWHKIIDVVHLFFMYIPFCLELQSRLLGKQPVAQQKDGSQMHCMSKLS